MSHAGCSGDPGQQAILGWTQMQPGQPVRRLGSKTIVAVCRLGKDQYVPQDQQAPHPDKPAEVALLDKKMNWENNIPKRPIMALYDGGEEEKKEEEDTDDDNDNSPV
jgi:hypothetical protein